MKTILVVVCLTFTALAQRSQLEPAVVSPQAAPGCLNAPSGLVSWWTGDTNFNDILAGNNPVTTEAVSLVPGEVSQGFAFGTKGYVQIPAAANLANQQFTWAAWVRPDGPGPTNDNFGNVILIQNIDGLHNAASLHWRNTDKRFTFDFGSVTSEIIVSTNSFPPGTFYFVAGTYDGSTFRLYVNGKLEGSYNEKKTIAYSSSGWVFGNGPPAYFSTTVRTWNGVIDEIQSFNRPLSQSELKAIYTAGSAGECKSPLIASAA